MYFNSQDNLPCFRCLLINNKVIKNLIFRYIKYILRNQVKYDIILKPVSKKFQKILNNCIIEKEKEGGNLT